MTARNDTISKVRVITLNYSAKKVVNFDVIKDMILGSGERTVMVHTEKKIKHKRKGRELWPYSPNRKIRCIESRSSNADVN